MDWSKTSCPHDGISIPPIARGGLIAQPDDHDMVHGFQHLAEVRRTLVDRIDDHLLRA